MEYRNLAGELVSPLGFGCMRLPTIGGKAMSGAIDEAEATKMLHRAIEGGVNYLDTAYHYHEGQSEAALGRALRGGWRERVLLATKAPVYSFTAPEDFERVLEEQLTRLQTDCIDFYLLHTLSLRTWNEIVLPFGLLEKMKKAKREGKVRHLGFSFHDDYSAFETILNGFDGWEFCQLQLNYAGTAEQAGMRGLEAAAAKGLGVIVMEPLLGGRLANPPAQVAKTLSPAKTPVEWALDFLWNRPEVSLVLSGMSDLRQTEENLTYARRAAVGMLDKEALTMLANAEKVFHTMALVPCTGCGYCLPCPFGVEIPAVYAAYNASVSHGTKEALSRRAAVKTGAEACTRCGQCEKACPQAIDGAALMPEVAAYFAAAALGED